MIRSLIFSAGMILSLNVGAQEYWTGASIVMPPSQSKYDFEDMNAKTKAMAAEVKAAYTTLAKCNYLEDKYPATFKVIEASRNVRFFFFHTQEDFASAFDSKPEDAPFCAVTFHMSKAEITNGAPHEVVLVNSVAWGESKDIAACPQNLKLYLMHEMLHVAGLKHPEGKPFDGPIQNIIEECEDEEKLRELVGK